MKTINCQKTHFCQKSIQTFNCYYLYLHFLGQLLKTNLPSLQCLKNILHLLFCTIGMKYPGLAQTWSQNTWRLEHSSIQTNLALSRANWNFGWTCFPWTCLCQDCQLTYRQENQVLMSLESSFGTQMRWFWKTMPSSRETK